MSWQRLYEDCESPIERLYLEQLQTIECSAPGSGSVMNWRNPRPQRPTIFVFGQQLIEQYRIDFVLVGCYRLWCRIVAVECDGREFHGISTILRDCARAFTIRGSMIKEILRFTGSQIYRAPTLVLQRSLAEFTELGIDAGELGIKELDQLLYEIDKGAEIARRSYERKQLIESLEEEERRVTWVGMADDPK